MTPAAGPHHDCRIERVWRGALAQPVWRRFFVAAVALASATGCASGDTSGRAAPAPGTPPKVDQFMIVDCLLPGQIRQLGGQVTYVTAPRPVKTAARDCEIRGGEYVAFDRADYRTALNVWLPKAKEGDPAAQTYVGEIFEKGLGVAPDYAAAAEWYRRAAEKGFSRAAINLGALYEHGLGAPKDPVQALTWYRRAAGLGPLQFDVAVSGAGSLEAEQLRRELSSLRQTLQAKEAELEAAKRDVEALKHSLDGRQREIDAERATLTRLRRELEEGRKTQGGSARVAELQKAVADMEGRLAARDREVAGLRADLARREAESKALGAQLDQIGKQAADTGPQIQILEPELVLVRDIQAMRAPAVADRVLVVGRVVAAKGVVSLTVNGREQALVGDNVFKAQIPVKDAEQRVRVTAVDRTGRKASLEFVVASRTEAPAAAAAPQGVGLRPVKERVVFGRYHALVIGNDAYKHLRPLETAVNDAREVARVLGQEYGFKVTLVLDANRYEILKALNDLRASLTEKDNLLIYYAGHGELDRLNQRGHWLPVDAEPQSSANWISNVSITDILNAMTVRQLLVVADSCYAGAMTRSALGQLEPGVTEGERWRAMQLMAQQRSRMVMTSGGVEPVLDTVGGRHSVFAEMFLSLLKSNVGVLSGQDAFQHLRLRVAAIADRRDVRQVPEYAPIKFAGHESGDFFFVRAN